MSSITTSELAILHRLGTDDVRSLVAEVRRQRALLKETIHTFYMSDRDEPLWADTGLGARIAAHLGLTKVGRPKSTRGKKAG